MNSRNKVYEHRRGSDVQKKQSIRLNTYMIRKVCDPNINLHPWLHMSQISTTTFWLGFL